MPLKIKQMPKEVKKQIDSRLKFSKKFSEPNFSILGLKPLKPVFVCMPNYMFVEWWSLTILNWVE
jgi:hypothetical protein